MNSLTVTPRKEENLLGIGASPGIAIGKVFVVDNGPALRRISIGEEEVAPEQHRFREAVARTEENLRQVRRHFSEVIADYASIIDTHLLILRDHMLYDRTLETVAAERINCEWALARALAGVEEVFAGLEDPYIRERFLDVKQVIDRVFLELAGEKRFPEPSEDRVVLAAHDFSPEDVLRMRSDRILGFFTEMGGATSHAAIVARTLGIPAVVGLKDLTGKIASGDPVILDGMSGRVLVNPFVDQLEFYRERQRQYQRYNEVIAPFASLRSETLDGLEVRVEANLELVDEVPLALKYGAAGIGLFRSEFFFLWQQRPPDEETLFALYREMLTRMAPRPVTVRTLDVGGDKRWRYSPDFLFQGAGDEKRSRGGGKTQPERPAGKWPVETNPALGLRAIRFCLKEPALFEMQLRALLRASVHGNLRVIYPMISSYCELIQVKEIVARVMAGLRRQGIPYSEDTRFGVMVEVPSAVAVADTLAREADFFSIGTNDLIQYALAIDRVNEHVAHMYEPLHPAVLRMIGQVVEAGHNAGIEVGICGEMAGDVTYIPVLLGLGLDAFSMHPLAIPYVKRMIRQSTTDEVEELVDRLLSFSASIDIREYLEDYLPHHYPEEFAGK